MQPFTLTDSRSVCPLPLDVALPASSKCVSLTMDELLRRYGEGGGMATGDHVANLLNGQVEQPVSVVARWIVGRRVVCLKSNGQLLLPLFQFDRARLVPHPEIADVVDALRDRLNERAIAAWFVTPHPALAGRWPMRVMREDRGAVVSAAHMG